MLWPLVHLPWSASHFIMYGLCRHFSPFLCFFGNAPIDSQHKGNHEKHLSTEKKEEIDRCIVG